MDISNKKNSFLKQPLTNYLRKSKGIKKKWTRTENYYVGVGNETGGKTLSPRKF